VDRAPHPLSSAKPVWPEYNCREGNNHVTIGTEQYFLSADGKLIACEKRSAGAGHQLLQAAAIARPEEAKFNKPEAGPSYEVGTLS
jgi:hypothetical protein